MNSKKIYAAIATGICLASFVAPTTAYATGDESTDDLFDLVNTIANEGSFGFGAQDIPTIKSVTDTSIELEAKVVNDEFGIGIATYKINIAPKPTLTLIEENNLEAIQSKEITIEPSGETFTFELMLDTDIAANSEVFVSIVPLLQGVPGTASPETNFVFNNILAEAKSAFETTNNQTTTTTTTTTDNTLASASNTPTPLPLTNLDTCTANLSWNQLGNTVNLTWSNTFQAKELVFSIRHTASAQFTNLATTPTAQGAYSFAAAQPGTHFLKIQAKDANGQPIGVDCVQTMMLQPFDDPQNPINTPIAPTNGPATIYLLGALLAAIIGYTLYRRRQLTA